MTPAKRPLSHRSPSPSPTPERRSLSPATLPVELEERLAQKRCIAVSSPDVAEEADDHYWRQALKQRARVCGHVSAAGYDIEVIDSDALRRAVSQVKWPTPNPSGSTAVDLIHGPAADLLWLAVNNLPFYIAIEPLLSFLKDTFCDAGLGSTASKSDLIDGDHEEGTLSGSSKGKEPICSSKGKAPVCDIREGTLQPCSSKGKEPICDNMERIQGPCSSHGNEPICDK